LNLPYAVAMDAFGNLFLVDSNNDRIRRVDPNGIITTVAGNGTYGFSGDGGAATNAQLRAPQGVAVDALGDVFIADFNNNRIREVTVNGIITTVAGNGTFGYSGDGGAAISARFEAPDAVALDTFGNLFIADYGNNRIREIVGMPVSPSTLFTYELGNAGSNNAGNYSVIISNTFGSITSTVAMVTVILSANPALSLSGSVTNGVFALNWNNLSATPPLSYQVQYTTNLFSPYWSNLGDVVTGTNPVMNFTDPMAMDVQRFYRIQFVQ